MRWPRISLALMLATAGAPLPALAAASPNCMPYVGERMTFQIGWEFINAGTATMSVARQGADGYRVDTLAKTNNFFDMLKKVRDHIVSEAVCHDGKAQSTSFDLHQHEGDYRATKQTRFLWRRGQATYSLNGKPKSYAVPAGYLNVMDAFYTVRRLPLKVGEVLRLPVFDAGKKYDVEVHVLKTEYQYMPGTGKRTPCLVIVPRLKSEGIFSSVGTMKIWLSDDARRIPMMMTAKIKFGRIIAKLIGYQPAP